MFGIVWSSNPTCPERSKSRKKLWAFPALNEDWQKWSYHLQSMFRFLQYHLPILTLRSSNMATGNPLYTKLSIGNSSIDFRDFPAMFGSQIEKCIEISQNHEGSTSPPSKGRGSESSECLEEAPEIWGRGIGWLDKKWREAVQMEPSNKKTGFNKDSCHQGT